MNAQDVAGAIEKIDSMIERCDRVTRIQRPLKPDTSLPRHRPMAPAVKNVSPALSIAPAPSFDPQQRFDQIRRERRERHDYCGTGYRAVCTGSFGSDVD